MDAHFDPTIYHPSFLGGEDAAHRDFFDTSFSHFLQLAHEYDLPADTVDNALHRAWDFFGMTEVPVFNDAATRLYPNNPTTYMDDSLGINLDQLKSLGIHDEDSLSLVCTHEAGHSITQYMLASGSITPWESELASDAMMGFRAAMQNLDTSTIEHSFLNYDCSTHPANDLRENYVQIGKEIYHELEDQHLPMTMDNFFSCLNAHLAADHDMIQQRETQFHNNTNLGQLGYSQSEIESKIHENEDKIDFYKSVVRNNADLAQHKAAHGEPHSFYDSNIRDAQFEIEKARKELQRWKNEKPEK